MDVLTVVEVRVRAGVRSRGLDPRVMPDDVRQLVDDAVANAVGVGDVRPVDAVAVGTAVFQSVAGLGPLQRLFDDPEVEEVWTNDRLTD